MRTAAGAELRQITRVTGVTAWSACWLQLHSDVDRQRQRLKIKLRKICSELKRALENICQISLVEMI